MRVRRLTMTAAMSAVTMLVAVATLAAPASAQPPGNQHLALIFRLPSSSLIGRAIGTGLVNGSGTVQDGSPVTVSLPTGTLLFEADNGVAATFDRRSCVAQVTGSGTVQVTGGSGAFTGATGDGTDTVSGTLVYPRNPDRSCNLGALARGVLVFHANFSLVFGGS